MENLRDIIYERVTDEYGWGKYGDFKVLIRRKDGYINATKLCQEGGKELYSWTRLEVAEKFMKKCEEVLQICRTSLLETYQDGKNRQLSGTYVHPDLVPHIASWISPDFAIKVSHIVNDHIVKEYRKQLEKKDEKIDELLTEVRGLKTQLETANRKLDVANENIIEAVRGVGLANQNIRNVQGTLNHTALHSVPESHVQRKDAETYAIYYCRPNMYIQCRARPYHLTNRERELRERYPNFRVVAKISPVPNARTLASEFERRITSLNATFNPKLQKIVLAQDGALTEQGMVAIAREVFEERKEPAEISEEKYSPVALDIDEEGKIFLEEEEAPAAPTAAEIATELMKKTMAELREIARTFPRSKDFGGWSKKTKVELADWIAQRQLQQ